LRGPSITSGYLNRDEETAALFDDEGWLKTGDIGQFDERGCLKIIDRVKNLVKTLNGEYIAIEKVKLL
jgi:long-chain acyl-CoA synthetase